METKFNFYDFVGYIIPGAVFALLIIWLLSGFLNIRFDLKDSEFFTTIVFITVSYFIGHLLQGFGSYIQNKVDQNKKRKTSIITTRKYSVDFLKIENPFYSPEFKNELYNSINKMFSINLTTKNIPNERYAEAFNLCYTFVIQENIGNHAEIFNGFYSFFRGLKITSLFGIMVNILIIINETILFFIPVAKLPLTQNFTAPYNLTTLTISIFLGLFFVISYFISSHRCDSFSKHFANSIYRSFLVFCKKTKFQNSLPR